MMLVMEDTQRVHLLELIDAFGEAAHLNGSIGADSKSLPPEALQHSAEQMRQARRSLIAYLDAVT